MAYDRIVISSGHGLHVRGAAGIIDEVDEARRVVERLAEMLEDRGSPVTTGDDTTTSQNENLWCITDFHNAQKGRTLAYFNASNKDLCWHRLVCHSARASRHLTAANGIWLA
jgi:N-acetylmuramoyl-L-alanine amidase